MPPLIAQECATRIVRIWAPHAAKVELQIVQGRDGSDNRPMFSDGAGWWTATLPDSDAPIDYLLRVDEGTPRPDPRSAWQPYGVHGPSRWVDHADYAWGDQTFQPRPLSSAVIYELHIGSFTREGTFESAIERLGHLVQLGVSHVELMPVADFPGKFGWGYDGVSLFAPCHVYGGPDGLKKLVDACHRHGLSVVLDVVYNHLGPCGNYLSEFGPYFSARHNTPWGAALNFDDSYSDGVRRFFCDNALMWLRDYHIDALRLDAVHAIVDTTAIPFLEQLATEVEQLSAHLGRHLALIAESDLNDPRIVRSVEAGGYGLDAQWCDDFHHALHTALSGERSGYYSDFGTIETLAKAFEQPFIYAGEHSPFRKRRHGRAAHDLSAHRFITYSQNHDQSGNRAKGERLNHLLNDRMTKVAAGLLLAGPYIPQLFQGEEWGSQSPFLYFADWRDEPELARAVVTGRQNEFVAFGWDPDDVPDPTAPETFELAKLDWSALTSKPHSEMFDWYRRLIALRRGWPDLTDGRLNRVSVEFSESERWLAVVRGETMIVANLSSENRVIPLNEHRSWSVLLSLDPQAGTYRSELAMSPESIMILSSNREVDVGISY